MRRTAGKNPVLGMPFKPYQPVRRVMFVEIEFDEEPSVGDELRDGRGFFIPSAYEDSLTRVLGARSNPTVSVLMLEDRR